MQNNTLEHLSILSVEEQAAVEKFKEFGAKVTLGYGSAATWPEMVHSSAYSENAFTTTIGRLRSKVNSQAELEDEDGTNVDKTEVTAASGLGAVKFTTEEVLLVVRSANKVRKNFTKVLADRAEITALEKEIAKLEDKVMTPAERLAAKKKLLESKTGIKSEVPTTTTTAEATA